MKAISLQNEFVANNFIANNRQNEGVHFPLEERREQDFFQKVLHPVKVQTSMQCLQSFFNPGGISGHWQYEYG